MSNVKVGTVVRLSSSWHRWRAVIQGSVRHTDIPAGSLGKVISINNFDRVNIEFNIRERKHNGIGKRVWKAVVYGVSLSAVQQAVVAPHREKLGDCLVLNVRFKSDRSYY